MENMPVSQPADKPWYKNWWGIILAILIWPFFIIWYAWARSNWSTAIRILVTVIGVLGFIYSVGVGASASRSDTATTSPSASPVIAAVASSTPAPTPIPTPTPTPPFDIPSLVGKNIDGIRTILGKPSDKQLEPSKDQVSLGDTEWSNQFDHSSYSLLVTYDAATRNVKDIFIDASWVDTSGSTSNKAALMQKAGITDSDSRYSLMWVATIKDPSKFTGVKIITK